MRDFSRSGGCLRALPFHARLVYSFFLAFTLVALALTAWLGADMVGADGSGVHAYYAGEAPAEASRAPAPSAGGPALDLPDDALVASAAEPMPLRKLLEVTHFHLFSLPVYLMILSHLFMLSRASSRTKTLWIGMGALAVAAHVAAPWIARAGSRFGAAFYLGSGALLFASLVVMSAVPLHEMWATEARRPD